jgi:hypothetical protein
MFYLEDEEVVFLSPATSLASLAFLSLQVLRAIPCKRYLTIAKPTPLPSDSARRIHTTEQYLVINTQHLELIILRVFAHCGALWIGPPRLLCES